MAPKKRLGEMLVDAGVIDEAQLKAALGHQRQWGVRLGQALVDMKLATEADIVRSLSVKFGFEVAALDALEPHALEQALALLPREFAVKNNVLPLAADTEKVTVAISDPTHLAVLDEVRFRTGRSVKVCIGGDRELAEALRRHYPEAEGIEDIALDLDISEREVDAMFDPFGGASKGSLEAFPSPALLQAQAAAPSPFAAPVSDPAARPEVAGAWRGPAAVAAGSSVSGAPAPARPREIAGAGSRAAPTPRAAAPAPPPPARTAGLPGPGGSAPAAAPAAPAPASKTLAPQRTPAPPPAAVAPMAAAPTPAAPVATGPAPRPPAPRSVGPTAPAPIPGAACLPPAARPAPAPNRPPAGAPRSPQQLGPAAPSMAACPAGPARVPAPRPAAAPPRAGAAELDLEGAPASPAPAPREPAPMAVDPFGRAPEPGAAPASAPPAPTAGPLTAREAAVLAALERLAGGAHAEPELLRPAQAMAALARVLLRKGIVSERELLDELVRKQSRR
jgi:hypothetical protein